MPKISHRLIREAAGLKPNRGTTETKLYNGVTVFGDHENAKDFEELVKKYDSLWNEKDTLVKIPESEYMPIALKPDWADNLKINRVYPLGIEDRAFVDETFDKLHQQGKMEWTRSSTPFGYPVFVVWRTVIKDGKPVRKGRAVVDIRGLNKIVVSDAYPMPTQADITAAVAGCKYISVIDAMGYFHQWGVKLEDRYKQTVISHRGQEQFNVAVMGFKNSPAYVQRQTDLLLKDMREFARTFIDDIVIFSRTRKEHLNHLEAVFERLSSYGVTLSPAKAFLAFPSLVLLGQVVDALGLTTAKEKLAAIAQLAFPRTLSALEVYLGLTGWMRNYVPYYAQIAEPLQNRKTILLRGGPTKGNPRKAFSKRTPIDQPTNAEYESYEYLQIRFSKPSFLVHFEAIRPTFIDVDASKERGFGVMIFHVQSDPEGDDVVIIRSEIQPIMFLSKILTEAETRYWPTELEVAGVVWVAKKVRHMIESCRKPPVTIFTDHAATAGLIKQTSLTTSNTDKLNLRLVRASQFLSALPIKIRVKPGKLHVVPDALSRLKTNPDSEEDVSLSRKESNETAVLEDLDDVEGLFAHARRLRHRPLRDVLSHHVNEILDTHLGEEEVLLEMSDEFKKALKEAYEADPQWTKIRSKIRLRNDHEDISDGMDFILKEDRLYYAPTGKVPRLCIPWGMERDVFQLVHDQNHHCGFHRAYARAAGAVYIRHLATRLRRYIRYCKQCLEGQTTRHAPYGQLAPIKAMALPFHTVTIDFIVSLPPSETGMDAVLTTTDKYSKRVSMLPGRTTWSAPQWAAPWLDSLQKEGWGLPRAILSDRDRKFVAAFWKATFSHLGTALLFTTAYHPQGDGQSERTNQTLEIALRFALMEGECKDFTKLLPSIQAMMNNSQNVTTGLSPHEILYGFKVLETADLLDNEQARKRAEDGNPPTAVEDERNMLRKEASDAISFAQTMQKIRYDAKRKELTLKEGDKVFLKLHKGYTQPGLDNRKFDKQRVGPISVLAKVGKLAYKLDIPSTWKIHPVVSVTHLEPAPEGEDPYEREPAEPRPVETEGDDEADTYEVERIVAKRMVRTGRGRRRRAHSEFRVKWTGWGDHHNKWMKRSELTNCKELLAEFEATQGAQP